MATTTTHLGLTKPELSDNITPTIFADNFEKIDEKFGEIDEKFGEIDEKFGEMGTQATYSVSGSTLTITTK